MTDVPSQCQAIAQMVGAQEQTTAFSALIDNLIRSKDISSLSEIPPSILGMDVSQAVVRSSMLHLAKGICSQLNDFYTVAEAAIAAIKNYTGSIDEADFEFRNGLFNYYITCAEYKEAAICLAGLNLDNTTRPYTDYEKADIHVKCAESCLLGDEALDAEMYVKRASELMNSADHQDKALASALNLRYRVIYARVLDANRKFIDAASRYYDISIISNKDVSEDELLVLLGKSVTCAVLAKAGPPRTRILASLFKDPRISTLESLPSFSQHGIVLSKMYTEQILSMEELNDFAESLLPHQKAITSEGYTVMEKAVIEHNLQAVSKIYDNIKIPELAKFLGMDASNAEKLVAKMITEERLQGYLDQTENLLVFSEVCDNRVLWNGNIKNICKEMTDCLQVVNDQYPQDK